MHLDFDELLAEFMEFKKSDYRYLVSVRRDANTLELFDGDGSEYRIEFEDWLQSKVFEAIEDDCDSTDWDAIARKVCESLGGGYYSLKEAESGGDLCT
ncbi:MAG: hypothetical protein U7126_28765 [Microcoleus sp.]